MLAILVECTDSALDPGNPGVIRTTRLLGRELQRDQLLRPVFILWDRSLRDYRLLHPEERERLASYGGPRASDLETCPDLSTAIERLRPEVLFLSEAPVDGQLGERLLWAYARSLKIASMLYDLIPLSHPVLCVPDIVRRFPDYVEGIAGVDALFPISAESLRQLERYAADHELPLPARRRVVWLPAQFSTLPRNMEPPSPGPVRFLSVGSIEPRKNQANLIAAFESLVRRRPRLSIELTLVGNRFAGAEALAERIDALTRELPSLRWTGIVDDERLADLYRQSSFTVYPSLVEGFGLPIMESLWMGRPCLCHEGGVMAELASGGGCLTVDMNDVAAIETALERLATDTALQDRLTQEAQARELRDWSSYGAEIARGLLQLAPANVA
jgi:glycosyltransferase involved in cell wall biosynthesis